MEAKARRVYAFDDIQQAGDYFLTKVETFVDKSPHRYVWFLLPIHTGSVVYERNVPGDGLHSVSESLWMFRECADGSLEIRPSILCGKSDEMPNGYFHGFLNEGNVWVWS